MPLVTLTVVNFIMAEPSVKRSKNTYDALLARRLLRAAVEGVCKRTKEHRTFQPLGPMDAQKVGWHA